MWMTEVFLYGSVCLPLCMSTCFPCILQPHTCRCSEQTALLPALKGPSLSIAKATTLRHQESVCLTACCSLLLAKHCTSQQSAHHTRHTHRHTCSCTHTCAHLHTPTAKHEDDSFWSILFRGSLGFSLPGTPTGNIKPLSLWAMLVLHLLQNTFIYCEHFCYTIRLHPDNITLNLTGRKDAGLGKNNSCVLHYSPICHHVFAWCG